MPEREILEKFVIDPNYDEEKVVLNDINEARRFFDKSLACIDKIEDTTIQLISIFSLIDCLAQEASNYPTHFKKAFKAKKAIQDYVFTDGVAEKSIERTFAEDLDNAEEVCVYAKLPRSFQIPTPVGNYAPDWAIAFNEGTVKHIYFVAETKGSMESLELRPIEQAKIKCAKKLFNELSDSKVVYHEVSNYQELLNVMNAI